MSTPTGIINFQKQSVLFVPPCILCIVCLFHALLSEINLDDDAAAADDDDTT